MLRLTVILRNVQVHEAQSIRSRAPHGASAEGKSARKAHGLEGAIDAGILNVSFPDAVTNQGFLGMAFLPPYHTIFLSDMKRVTFFTGATSFL